MSSRTMDLPFDGITNSFIVFFVQYNRNIDHAAKACHITTSQAKRLYRRPAVRAEIDKQLDVHLKTRADIAAQAMYLTEARLDSALVGVMENPESPARDVVRAVEVGYKKFGLLKEKVEHTGENGGAMVFTIDRIVPKKVG